MLYRGSEFLQLPNALTSRISHPKIQGHNHTKRLQEHEVKRTLQDFSQPLAFSATKDSLPLHLRISPPLKQLLVLNNKDGSPLLTPA